MRKVELLAPAKNADIGIEAFRHGADAVYIGAPSFGARAAACNTVADIERLASYGHQFGAKTIIALNTILTDNELSQAQRLAWQLYEAGADALIIQDFGLLQVPLPPIELHASTQTDNRTAERVRLLHDMGMTRVVLARELSIAQIQAIHEAVPDVELECFVHGALCVCYSGQCYLSAALTGRSANRGECSQPCRLPMDLLTPDGQIVARQRHLLSLRDMNRSAVIEQLIDAGVTSLKIEGRLKEMSYVKNVVAYYRKLIDGLMEYRPDWAAASRGHCSYTFDPCLAKSFNRGFTPYFVNGQREPMWNMESPKSMGEKVGTILKVGRDSLVIGTEALRAGDTLHNGDGLVVGGIGFRLNRFDEGTATCYPLDGGRVCASLKKGQTVYRNLDFAFEQMLSRPSAQRMIPVTMAYQATADRVCLRIIDDANGVAEVCIRGVFASAQRPQNDNVVKQMSRLGNTPYGLESIEVRGGEYFVPSSVLAELRRMGVAELQHASIKLQTELRKSVCASDYASAVQKLCAKGILPEDYTANVLNLCARQTYADMGIKKVDDAFEIQPDKAGMLMQTKHCLKYAFGQCPRYSNPLPEHSLDMPQEIGPEMRLKIGNKKFILKFGCKNDCVSKIFTIFAPKKSK